MTTLREAAEDFLAQDRIAVAGVSRDSNQPANLIYRRLRETGRTVFAANPNANEVEGDRCYAAVTDIVGGVGGVGCGASRDAADASGRWQASSPRGGSDASC
jgi:predicted CoA-binding protein